MRSSSVHLYIGVQYTGFHRVSFFFMQNRSVNAIIAGFKSACGLLVPLDFDPVGLWAAGTVS